MLHPSYNYIEGDDIIEVRQNPVSCIAVGIYCENISSSDIADNNDRCSYRKCVIVDLATSCIIIYLYGYCMYVFAEASSCSKQLTSNLQYP